jgi:hypothetical protein
LISTTQASARMAGTASDAIMFTVLVRAPLDFPVLLDEGALADAVLDPDTLPDAPDAVPLMCLANDWKAVKSLGAAGALTEKTIPVHPISHLIL